MMHLVAMKNASAHTLTQFYQKLGYLFYSIAAADRHVAGEEVDTLHKMVQEDWLNLETSTDAFGTDMAYQIEIAFDLIRDKAISSERAFEVFEEWYHEHALLFDEDVVRRIHHTTSRIANSFHSANKSETAMLFRIKSLLGGERQSI
jgi:hypothetical protein